MSNSLWYYSREDSKRGPVTSSELHRLAHKRKLFPDDLVWCHGMESWVPARTIRGIFPEDDDAGLLTDIFEGPPSPPRDTEEQHVADSRHLKTPRLGPPELDQANYYDRPESERPNRSPVPLEQQWTAAKTHTSRWLKRHSRWLILFSLVVAASSRGCDQLGMHEVERRQASLELVETQFSAIHDKKLARCQDRIVALQSQPQLTLAESQELQQQRGELTRLQNSRALELAQFQDDAWHRLRLAAESARASYSHWSLFRKALLIGSILALIAGCFSRFYRGDSTERLLCGGLLLVVALAVIVFPKAI